MAKCDISGCEKESFYKFNRINLKVCFDCFVKLQEAIDNEDYYILDKGASE